jgi:hypothetical protein
MDVFLWRWFVNGDGCLWRLFVNVDKCTHFAKCLERQIYDDYGQPDKSAGFDHMNDAGTYPIAYLFAIDKKSVGVRRIRGMS